MGTEPGMLRLWHLYVYILMPSQLSLLGIACKAEILKISIYSYALLIPAKSS